MNDLHLMPYVQAQHKQREHLLQKNCNHLMRVCEIIIIFFGFCSFHAVPKICFFSYEGKEVKKKKKKWFLYCEKRKRMSFNEVKKKKRIKK
jgi:hypothetical protein